jgi:hypothetical protein
MADEGDRLKLTGAVTEGSGVINEDGFGFIGSPADVSAAWVFDGVTGINGRNHLRAVSDAAWLVSCAHRHLLRLAGQHISLSELLEELVSSLMDDWAEIVGGLDLPAEYDPPAACLILVKRYGAEWKALRLGDSCLLARDAGRNHRIFAASPNNVFDNWLSGEARKRRDAGVLDIKALLAEFRPQLLTARKKRNQPDGYSILECSKASLAMPEYIDLGSPAEVLLCTDGYYRAVDHYGLHDDASLIDASLVSVKKVLEALRAVEAGDPDCMTYPRFKPADDATALMLSLKTTGDSQ